MNASFDDSEADEAKVAPAMASKTNSGTKNHGDL